MTCNAAPRFKPCRAHATRTGEAGPAACRALGSTVLHRCDRSPRPQARARRAATVAAAALIAASVRARNGGVATATEPANRPPPGPWRGAGHAGWSRGAAFCLVPLLVPVGDRNQPKVIERSGKGRSAKNASSLASACYSSPSSSGGNGLIIPRSVVRVHPSPPLASRPTIAI